MITFERIIGQFAKDFGYQVDELKGERRTAPLATVRQLSYMACINLLPKMSVTSIGRRYDRDHTTILHGLKAAQKKLQDNPDLRNRYIATCEKLLELKEQSL
jgi:chromosomal replication initiator protein